MKNFFKISIAFFLLTVNSFAKHISIITTDSYMLNFLQKDTQNLAITENSTFSISFVEDRKTTRYFQIGNEGDVLITSNQNLCQSLAEKGLAGNYYTTFATINVYCTDKTHTKPNNLIILHGKYTQTTHEMIEKIGENLHSSVYFVEKDENIYEKIKQILEKNQNICGFLPLFHVINFETKNLIKTPEQITYYICPIIGLNSNAYNILTKQNEKKNN